MKILFIANVFFPHVGGSSRIYYEICSRLLPDEVCVYTQKRLAWEEEEVAGWREFDRKQKYKTYRVRRLRSRIIKDNRGRGIFHSLIRLVFLDLPLMCYVFTAFSCIIFKEKIRIICLENPDYLGWIALIGKYIFRKKIIFYLHGEELTAHTGAKAEKKRFYYLKKADKLIANSEFTKRILDRNNLGDKTVIIRPGVSIELRQNEQAKSDIYKKYGLRGKKVLLSIARLEEYKGIDNILRAMTLVLRRIPDAVYLIGGCGMEEESLKNLAKELRLGDSAIFLGQVSTEDLPVYYGLCDVFILANRQTSEGVVDGFGMVFIEAGSFGKPVIGGNAGGVPEAILDGQTGILVNGEDVDGIAGAILRLLEKPELAKKLGENGRQRALEFGWDRVAVKFQKACLELTGR